MKILLSNKTMELLRPHPYAIHERGDIEVKVRINKP